MQGVPGRSRLCDALLRSKFVTVLVSATGYASQHICCLSQARINWEGCVRKGIRRKNGRDGRGGGTN